MLGKYASSYCMLHARHSMGWPNRAGILCTGMHVGQVCSTYTDLILRFLCNSLRLAHAVFLICLQCFPQWRSLLKVVASVPSCQDGIQLGWCEFAPPVFPGPSGGAWHPVDCLLPLDNGVIGKEMGVSADISTSIVYEKQKQDGTEHQHLGDTRSHWSSMQILEWVFQLGSKGEVVPTMWGSQEDEISVELCLQPVIGDTVPDSRACPVPVFYILPGVSSGCAWPITRQVTSVTWPVIDWA